MSKKRVGYFDALNVVSCIAVVTMHVNGTSLYTFHHSVSWLSSLFMLFCGSCVFYVNRGNTYGLS